MAKEKKAVLIILDGWGHRTEKKDNAIACAMTPYYSRLFNKYPYTVLQASESYVGLPQGVMGNSEVGHTNIGCGRKVEQEQVRIYASIADQSFFKNPKLLKAIETTKEKKGSIHLMGLVSTGNVHSAQEHYFALLKAISDHQFEMNHCFFHAFLDGRDTPPKSALEFMASLEGQLQKTGGRIATVSGRFYAMDRDQRWERTQKAYDAIVSGKGPTNSSAQNAITQAYQNNITDEFIEPVVLLDQGKPPATIKDQDLVICFNFRADRMRQMVRALKGDDQTKLNLANSHPNLMTMTSYGKQFEGPVLFAPQNLQMCMGEYLSSLQKSQFRCAETEKYAHVTFFLNGGREAPFNGEHRLLIPSPKVSTYDKMPAMHSKQVTQAVVQQIKEQHDDFIVVNYAQPDMVGHTGNWDAAIEAVQATDQAIKEVCETALAQGYLVFLTADHGNIEMMRDPITGQVHTSHTLNPVPLIMIGEGASRHRLKAHGSLSNIAPTVLQAMGMKIPKEMTASSLLVNN